MAMTFEATYIQVLDYNVRFQAHFGFCIDGSLHYILKAYGFLVLFLYLDLNGRLSPFSEIPNHSELIWGFSIVKLRQDGLELLKVGCLVLGLFQLVLEIPPKLNPDTVNKSLRTFEISTEEDSKLKQWNRSGALMTTLVLSLSKANKITENYGSKKGIIYLYGI